MYKKIYKPLTWSSILLSIISCLFLMTTLQGISGIIIFVLFGIALLSTLFFSIAAFNILPGKIPLLPLNLGLFLIIGGAIFDIANTVIHSPDLTQEANPIIRHLLNAHFSLKKIYLLGGIYQLLLTSTLSILWATFLKAYPIMLEAISPANLWQTTVFIFSGPKASSLDFLIGRSDYFHFITSITPILVSLSLYRWYLGLEWLNLVPISHVFVPIFISFVSIFFYSFYSYKKKLSLPIF